jgi:hypothetical protein
MATSNEVVGQSAHTSDPILRVVEETVGKPIPSTIYDVQSKAGAFRHASTPEKRCRLFDEFVKSNRVGVVMALACTSSKGRCVCVCSLGPAGDDGFRTAVLDHLEQAFPTTVNDFQSSSAKLAIQALESFYSSAPTSEFSERLYEHQRTFLLATSAFDALTLVDLQPPDSPVRESGAVAPPKRTSQRVAKKARTKRPDLRIDDTPFNNLGFHRPTTPLEYNSMVDEVLDKLKGILRVRTRL